MAAGVDAARATPEPIAVLEASHPKAKTSDYDLLPRGAGTDARERAIVRLSIDLTSRPSDFGAAQLHLLEQCLHKLPFQAHRRAKMKVAVVASLPAERYMKV